MKRNLLKDFQISKIKAMLIVRKQFLICRIVFLLNLFRLDEEGKGSFSKTSIKEFFNEGNKMGLFEGIIAKNLDVNRYTDAEQKHIKTLTGVRDKENLLRMDKGQEIKLSDDHPISYEEFKNVAEFGGKESIQGVFFLLKTWLPSLFEMENDEHDYFLRMKNIHNRHDFTENYRDIEGYKGMALSFYYNKYDVQ